MEMFSVTKEGMEENYDAAKVAVIRALITEGYLDPDEAEHWCKTHTIILRKKNIFRTLSRLWEKTEISEPGHYILVVSTPEAYEDEDNEGSKEPLPIDNNEKVIRLR